MLDNFRVLKNVIHNENIVKKSTLENSELMSFIDLKIEELETKRVEESLFHSKCNWAKLGERNSKYFFALEKRNYHNKTMFSIMLPNGEMCKEQKVILAEQRHFYEILYTSDPTICFNITSQTGIVVPREICEMLDKPLSIEELYTALFSMKSNKTPGVDGLTKEWFLTFWEDIKDVLWGMFSHVIQQGRLGRTSKRGFILLLPKKDKDTRYMKNYRPLTLLCLDYKILAKSLG